MSSISSQQLWIVNFQLWIRVIIVLHKSSAIMNCELQLWILWLPFELLPRILDVPRTFLRRILNVPWMYLESIFCLVTILLPSSYLLPTFLLPSFYLLPTHYFVFTKRTFHIIIVLWKNSAFINSELIWFFNFQLSTHHCQLSTVLRI